MTRAAGGFQEIEKIAGHVRLLNSFFSAIPFRIERIDDKTDDPPS